MEKIKDALLKMGYRTMSPGVFGKPLGHTLITFEIDKMLLTQWFTSPDGKPCIWNSEILNAEDDFLIQIKTIETYGIRVGIGNYSSSFEFLTPEQVMSGILG